MGRPTRTPPDVKRGEVQPPTVLNNVAPEYSEEARKAKLQGVVVLSIIIDETGLAQNIKVVRALGLGEDFFACTIVVANATEIAEAEKLIGENFAVKERRPPRPAHTHRA